MIRKCKIRGTTRRHPAPFPRGRRQGQCPDSGSAQYVGTCAQRNMRNGSYPRLLPRLHPIFRMDEEARNEQAGACSYLNWQRHGQGSLTVASWYYAARDSLRSMKVRPSSCGLDPFDNVSVPSRVSRNPFGNCIRFGSVPPASLEAHSHSGSACRFGRDRWWPGMGGRPIHSAVRTHSTQLILIYPRITSKDLSV